jgi:hypothetical protein
MGKHTKTVDDDQADLDDLSTESDEAGSGKHSRDGRSRGGRRQPASDSQAWPTNARYDPAGNASTGPSAFFESRTATTGPPNATSTRLSLPPPVPPL